MTNWQTPVTVTILILALLYVGRRAWLSVRPLLFKKARLSGDCGSCKGCSMEVAAPTKINNS